jgi:quercetin dioxygenase-like cupin family protein
MRRRIVVFFGVAGLIGLVAGGTALGTLGSHTFAQVLAKGTITDRVHVHTKDVSLKINGPTDAWMVTQSWDPGGYSGWHSHPGPVIFTLNTGELTIYDQNCNPRVLEAGEGFVETPNQLMNVRNEGTVRATAHLTVLSPAGELPREDGPKPAPNCAIP